MTIPDVKMTRMSRNSINCPWCTVLLQSFAHEFSSIVPTTIIKKMKEKRHEWGVNHLQTSNQVSCRLVHIEIGRWYFWGLPSHTKLINSKFKANFQCGKLINSKFGASFRCGKLFNSKFGANFWCGKLLISKFGTNFLCGKLMNSKFGANIHWVLETVMWPSMCSVWLLKIVEICNG